MLDWSAPTGGFLLQACFSTGVAAAQGAGAQMIYVAMFDEVDEGTAIFKCTNDVPVGESKFSTFEGLPSDAYLKLVGAASKMIRGDAPLTPGVHGGFVGQRALAIGQGGRPLRPFRAGSNRSNGLLSGTNASTE